MDAVLLLAAVCAESPCLGAAAALGLLMSLHWLLERRVLSCVQPCGHEPLTPRLVPAHHPMYYTA